jgi:GxxExxY protein
LKYPDLTEAVICCFYTVYNKLGFGFLEKVYLNALLLELSRRGLTVSAQAPINVYYDGVIVGQYFADILVNNSLIVEIKTARNLLPEHEAQLLNYLKSTAVEVGLLLNFGPSPQIKRKLLDNDKKGYNANWCQNDASQ